MSPRRVLSGFWQLVHRVEDVALVALLLAMILLAVAQILLRNLGDSSIVWADPFLRVAVLWIGMLGAMIAARDNEHIAIDIATRYLPDRLARFAAVLTALFAAGICAVVFWYSLVFVREEYAYATPGFAAVPAWVCEVVIPVAFAVMTVRYLNTAVQVGLGRRSPRREYV